MKTIHFECAMGAAGDMLCAALFELCGEKERTVFLDTMNALFPGVVEVAVVPDVKQGITGARMIVSIRGEAEGNAVHGHAVHEPQAALPHGHAQRTPEDVGRMIRELPLPESVKANAREVYAMIAQAESHVHGRTVAEVHFHELGMLDAIVDVVGFCLLVDLLRPEEITASPVHVGSGVVKTAHGVLPVPAPATSYLLAGVPVYAGDIAGELCTPTGAALLKRFCARFLPMPPMSLLGTGYGMGTKDFAALNCVRAFLGDCVDARSGAAELRCNIDDMTPEAVGYAVDVLMASGVMDVFVQHATMKKNRPGFMIVCLCACEDVERTAELLFKHTTTIGIRRFDCAKYLLDRRIDAERLPDCTVRVKTASGYGLTRSKFEYDDVADYARRHDISFGEATEFLAATRIRNAQAFSRTTTA